MILRRLARPCLIALTLVAASGCKQGSGDRCQLNSDCQDGLTCVVSPNATLAEGGTCQSTTAPAVDAAAPDATPPPGDSATASDAATGGDDASSDAATPPGDAASDSASDGGASDLLGSDGARG